MHCWLRLRGHRWEKIAQGITLEMQGCLNCSACRYYDYGYPPHIRYWVTAGGVIFGFCLPWLLRWLFL